MSGEDGPVGSESRTCARRSVSICIAIVVSGCAVYYLYPAWVHGINDLQRRKRSSLHIPTEMKLRIASGDPVAAQWLEEKICAGKGSVPALLLLQSMTGETFGEVPNYCRAHGFCGNTSRRQRYRWMNQEFQYMRELETEALRNYEKRKGVLTFDRFSDLDLKDVQSVQSAFRHAWEEEDGGQIYLLLGEEAQGPDFFWHAFRYIEWLHDDNELTFKIDTRKEDPRYVESYVEILNEIHPGKSPQGHGVFYVTYENPETGLYEIRL